MRNLRKLGVGILCLGCAAGAVFAGCSSDDSSGGTATNDAGGGGDSTAASTLYTRLGGHAGIRAAVNAIVGKELLDTDIASYFVYQTMTPTPAGHPNVDQLEECLTDQLGNAAGGPETYPTTVTDDAGTWTCRDMKSIHAQFNISGGTFSQFVMIAANELQALGVAPADITAVGGVLTGTSSEIVNATLADAGELPFTPTDGGADAGTLYQRLGGHAGIRGAVDAIVAQELNDPDIVTYFFNQTASVVPSGHPTADQLEECFTDLLAKAAGGTEAYPETVTDDAGSFACRSDMGAIHQPLKISGGTFTKFVMIAGTVLQNAHVATSDIATIASVLDATQGEIVDPNLADAGSMAYDAASP
jgi:hemoglobin